MSYQQFYQIVGLFLLVQFGDVKSQTELFTHFDLVLQPGVTFPQREISGTLKREFFGQIIFKTPYYKKFNSQIVFGYTPLQEKLLRKPANLVKMAIGLEFVPESEWKPHIGLELGNYILVLKDINNSINFESEFGTGPFFCWDIPLSKSLQIRPGMSADIIFTAPDEIYFLNFNIGVEWSLW